jgi:hypothetical protein
MLIWALRFLGFGKSIFSFIGQNWKIFLPIILVIGAYFYHKHALNEAYDEGVKFEWTRVKALADAQDKRNREFETQMDSSIKKYGQQLLEDAAERVKQETIHTEKIKTIVQNNPVYEQCLVDQEVINLRNQTRALGPKVEN